MQNVNSKAKRTVYNVLVQGWGDSEEAFYNCGTFSTHAKAQQHVEKLLQEWEADGSERSDVVWDIEAQVVA